MHSVVRGFSYADWSLRLGRGFNFVDILSTIQSYSALFPSPALTFFILYIVIPSSTFIIPAYISDEKEEKTVK